jgi:16S rRNA (adenine1518-N6/adenine1519-N6)-dimethyltransferase
MDKLGANAVRELLLKHGFRFSKSMGQNFLVDPNIPERIVNESGIDSLCGVLEIGPGIGALTVRLSEAAAKVTAVELDKKLLPILSETISNTCNVEIVQGDILKLDIAELVKEKMPNLRLCVCANLPYNITTPALTALIEAKVFDTITVMIQREVAKRICAKPGTADYGSFTVYANYHTIPKILFDVHPQCFMPKPSVFSSVISMKVRSERLLNKEDEKLFFRVVRAAFSQRRKTLANALHAEFNTKKKEEIVDIISHCGFDTLIRGEALSLSDFTKLSYCLVTD